MNAFEFKVKIEASSQEEAKEILQAMFDLMKTTRQELSTRDFIDFAKKIKSKPGLVKKAKMFI
jgi:acyl-CoA reductase-like NAD-dependent aldehyde dehydrogenase